MVVLELRSNLDIAALILWGIWDITSLCHDCITPSGCQNARNSMILTKPIIISPSLWLTPMMTVQMTPRKVAACVIISNLFIDAEKWWSIAKFRMLKDEEGKPYTSFKVQRFLDIREVLKLNEAALDMAELLLNLMAQDLNCIRMRSRFSGQVIYGLLNLADDVLNMLMIIIIEWVTKTINMIVADLMPHVESPLNEWNWYEARYVYRKLPHHSGV